VEILAIDVIPSNTNPIENCCDLGYRQHIFSEIVNKPKVYKFKNFCNNHWSSPIRGYCDTLTDGGGWLVVQRRIVNDAENFHRDWSDYEKGFGSLTGELWYGLRALHCLTWNGNWELRIDFTMANGTKSFMHYNHFRVGPATDNYQLSISGFTGITPNDPFTTVPLNGQWFSTRDKANDPRKFCAVSAHSSNAPGGWWYNFCFHINLNYKYGGPTGFIYLAGTWHSPPFIEMKIRPSDCEI